MRPGRRRGRRRPAPCPRRTANCRACVSSKRSTAAGWRACTPERRRSRSVRGEFRVPERGASGREVTGGADVHDVLLSASHAWDSRLPPVGGRCDSGVVTVLHPLRAAPESVLPGAELLASVLAGTDEEERPVTHVHHVPVRESSTLPWPEWLSPALRSRLEGRGVLAPWRHQVDAAQLAREGRHVVVATGTASGKSLAYQLPALTRLAEDPRACVLYLAPTKALARD